VARPPRQPGFSREVGSRSQVVLGGFDDNNSLAASTELRSTDYTVSINWGDSPNPDTGTVAANADGSFSVLSTKPVLSAKL